VREQEQMAYYGHHTPPVSQPRFPPPQPAPERNVATPLSHVGYAPPPQPPPNSHSQRQFEFNQEVQQRNFEQERSRQIRNQREALKAEEVQRRRQQEAELRRTQEQAFRRPEERYTGMPPR
jgi:hypothetical protein